MTDEMKANWGTNSIDYNTSRIDVIGQNGNDGEHYTPDEVKMPEHYQLHNNYEVKDLMADVMAKFIDTHWVDNAFLYYPYINAIKYTLRWPFKGSNKEECERDLDKAIECLQDVKRNLK